MKTREGQEGIHKELENMREELKHLKKASKENVDDDPSGRLISPNKIQIHRVPKRDDDR